MKAKKHELFKAIFKANSASNQKIFGIYVSLLVNFHMAYKKVQKLKMVFAGLFTSVHTYTSFINISKNNA